MPNNAVEAAANRAIRTKMGLASGEVPPSPNPQQAPAGTPQGPAAHQGTPPQQAQAPAPVTADQLTALQNQIASMQASVEASRQQTSTQQNHIANLEGELAVLRNREDAKALQLPSDDELDELPRAEAIRRCAEVIAEQKLRVLDQKYLGAFSRLASDVVTMKNSSEERMIREQFPGVDIEKYRPILEQKRAMFPQASTVDLIRLVADPKELAQQPDMTQTPQDAVHMEVGQGAGMGAGGQGQQSREQITEDQLREGFVNARNAGQNLQAQSYLMEIIKRRPDVPTTRNTGRSGG